jgi:hypothetical protein
VTAFRPPPERHWRSYGTDPLPTPGHAGADAGPSWFLRVDRFGKVVMHNESHMASRVCRHGPGGKSCWCGAADAVALASLTDTEKWVGDLRKQLAAAMTDADARRP